MNRVCRLKDIGYYVNSHVKNYINYVSTENMLPNKGGILTASIVPQGTVIEYKVGDILISNIRPYFRKIWYAVTNGGCSNDVLCIRATEKVNSKFLYYLLCQQSFFDYVMSGAKGSKMPRGDKKQIMQWEICLPPLAEQKRIANILSALDDKIELNRRINENLEQQAQALFKHWFVDYEFPNEDGKPYKSSGGKFVKSELGNIPKDWKVVNYTDIISVKSGGTPKTDVVEYWGGNIPFFSPKDVPYSCYVLKTEKSVTKAGLDNCNSALYPKNTVFITARGTVGKVVLAGRDMAMNQTNYALIGKDGICQYYVYHITLQLVERLRKKANGAVFSAITTRDFASERIVVPCNHVIDFFKDRVRPIYKHILLNNIENERLSAIRDTLLPQLMNNNC